MVWEDERERQCSVLNRKNFFVIIKRMWGKDFFIHMLCSIPAALKKVSV